MAAAARDAKGRERLTTTNEAIQIGFQLVMIANLASLAFANWNPVRAQRSAARLYEGNRVFRWGMFLILIGIAIAAEADAVRYTASLARADPSYTASTLAGSAMVAAGLTVINAVLLSRRYDAPAVEPADG